MIVKNLSKKTIVTQNCHQATTFMELLLGLHWLSNPPSLLFQTRFGIHTILLKQPIDVVILDNQFKVMKLKPNLLPNYFFFWNPKYQWVLELPAGIIKKSKINLGDQLIFDPKPQS